MATPTFFGPEFVVNTTTSGIQTLPSIAGLAGGKFVAVWVDNSGGGFQSIRAQQFNADGSKSGIEFAVNGNEISDSTQPSVTALEDGRYVVAWTHTSPDDGGDGSGSSVKARIFNVDGSPFSGEFLINQETQLDQSEVSIAALRGGGFSASWTHQFSANDFDIHAQSFDANGNALVPEIVVDSNLDGEFHSSTTGLRNGDFVTVWQDSGAGGESDGSGTHIRAQIFDAAAGKFGAEFIVNSTTAGNQFEPTVTALQNGGFAVGWTHPVDANDTDIRVRLFSAGGTQQGADFVIDGGIDVEERDIAMVGLPNGDLFVTWTDAGSAAETDGSGSHIRGAIVGGVTGTQVGEEFVINTTAPSDQFVPSVTLLADGRVVVTWMDQSQSGGAAGIDVRAQIIDPRTAAVNLIGIGGVDDWVGTGFDDTMNGKGGADRMAGGGDNDTYFVDNAKDVIVEALGKGNDLVASSISYVLAAGSEVETLRTTSNGGTAAIDLTGNAFAQTIIGNAGDNVIRGGGGNDTLQGLGGNDTYFVDSADAIVVEGAGQGLDDVVATTVSYALDAAAQVETLRTTSNAGTKAFNLVGNDFAQTIIGNAAANIVKGLEGNDDLKGLAGNDTLLGGDGADVLTGGFGLDVMNGGLGKDFFIFAELAESGIGSGKRDVIEGFAVGDKIDVSAIDSIAGGLDNSFTLDVGGAFVAGEIHQTVSGGNLIIDFNVDGDAAAEMSLLLAGQTVLLSAGDFVL